MPTSNNLLAALLVYKIHVIKGSQTLMLGDNLTVIGQRVGIISIQLMAQWPHQLFLN